MPSGRTEAETQEWPYFEGRERSRSMSKVKPIDFRAETFDYIKDDLNNELNLLLKNMEDMGSDAGKLTMTITVTLEDKELDDGDEHTVPEFKHKIKIVHLF